MALHVSSTAFTEGQSIPEKYTCDGQNVSPPLNWSGAPENTKSMAIVADDPDAPSGTFTHWVLYDLPAKTAVLMEGSSGGGKEGVNGFKENGIRRALPSAEWRAPLFLPCLRLGYRFAGESRINQTGRYRHNEGTHPGRRSNNGHIQEKGISSNFDKFEVVCGRLRATVPDIRNK